jgi:bis(5'-nucleosyl)-tetraphosphatase (symmetrical)
MGLYLIGDVQGCDAALGRLLDTVDFSPSRDTLYLLGDLVNRGPASEAVLRRLMRHGDAACCLLGNHDLSLLAVAHGVRDAGRNDTLGAILDAPDRAAMLDWLRHQRMALHAHGWLMVHAGVLPQWDASDVLRLAAEVQTVLRGPDLAEFLGQMYGNAPARWDESVVGAARLRVIVNALTRLRFCTPDGTMELKASGRPDQAPEGTLPWFDIPGRRSAGTPVAFGHWSTLGHLRRDDLLGLDTGCVWGGCLSSWRLAANGQPGALFQVRCEASQAPGE